MKKLILVAVAFFFLACFAFAEEGNGSTNDNSVRYVINAGDGTTIIIFGDNNVVEVNSPKSKDLELPLNKIYFSGDKMFFIAGPTDVEIDGVIILVSRAIFVFEGNTWELLWIEQ
jgi:hypothetical protein